MPTVQKSSLPYYRVVRIFFLLIIGVACATPSRSWAQSLDALIPDSTLSPLLKTFSILTAHRPYQGAASLKAGGGAGFEFGLEALLLHMPADLTAAVGGSGGLSVLPSARVHLGYAISPFIDVGISGLWYLGTYFAGGSLKLLLWAPEEGPTLAVRTSYNYTYFDYAGIGLPLPDPGLQGADSSGTTIILATHTLSPQVVLSKRLNWAEPYLFSGFDISTGIVTYKGSVSFAGQTVITTSSSPRKVFWGFIAGSGFIIRVPLIGLKIALEGAYSSLGMPTLGAQIGLSF